ncbi:hypothetical protein HRbin15_02691 [bacterium HR15]|nr:hypothetical protein HRbin15_02691 [bacterium HR15]
MRNERVMVRFGWHAFASKWVCASRYMTRRLLWFDARYRLTALLSLSVTLNALFATAPNTQVVPANHPAWNWYYGVVHISRGNDFVGTGYVIDRKQVGNDFWLCVLTANHVVATQQSGFRWDPDDQLTIGFGNLGGNDPAFTTRKVFTVRDSVIGNDLHAQLLGNDIPDLAVIGVRVNQQIWNRVSPYELHPAVSDTTFTIVGYGNTDAPGARFISQPHTFGIKRFANNSVLQIFNGPSPYLPAFFMGAFIKWDLTDPGGVEGEGVTFGGDSGSPYFFSEPSDVNGIPVFTNKSIGVHHGGRNRYLNGDKGHATALTGNYINWINAKCELVPEPGSLLILLGGSGWALLLYRRRVTT